MLSTKVLSTASRVGANRLPNGSWEFLLWAPYARSVSVHLLRGSGEFVPMEPLAEGYHHAFVQTLEPGSEYFYQLDGDRDLPDPASRYQPQGVHGPSQVVDLDAFDWTDDNWKGTTLESSIFYELHVGTYTPEGTFDAVIRHLPDLTALGITTIELMPVAQFPGPRNWSYDGVYPFAPQNTYGGPAALQRLINAAHQQGLSVTLDVVYNHLGPEGNWRDGCIKLYLIWKALRFRRDHDDLFRHGEFIPLQSAGSYSRNVIAFIRRKENSWALAAVPQWFSQVPEQAKGALNWGDTQLILPSDSPAEWNNILTPTKLSSKNEAGKQRVMVSDLFQEFSVAFFYAEGN